jgi:hypothetical protein
MNALNTTYMLNMSCSVYQLVMEELQRSLTALAGCSGGVVPEQVVSKHCDLYTFQTI